MSNLALDEVKRLRLLKSAKYKKLFSSPLGKEVLADILYSAKLTRPCLTEKEEGARTLGLAILKQVNGNYNKMLDKLEEIEEDGQY